MALCLVAGHVPGVRITATDYLAHYQRSTNMYVGFALYLNGSSAIIKLAVHDHDLAVFLGNRDGYRGYRPIEEITEERHAARDPDRTGCAVARAVIEQRVQQYATWQAGALQRWRDIQNLDQAFIAV